MVRDGWNRGPKGGHMNLEAKCRALAAMKWPELKDHKGANMDEWPEDLRVREFPNEGMEGK